MVELEGYHHFNFRSRLSSCGWKRSFGFEKGEVKSSLGRGYQTVGPRVR